MEGRSKFGGKGNARSYPRVFVGEKCDDNLRAVCKFELQIGKPETWSKRLDPKLELWKYLAWKTYQVFPGAAEIFIRQLKRRSRRRNRCGRDRQGKIFQ